MSDRDQIVSDLMQVYANYLSKIIKKNDLEHWFEGSQVPGELDVLKKYSLTPGESGFEADALEILKDKLLAALQGI